MQKILSLEYQNLEIEIPGNENAQAAERPRILASTTPLTALGPHVGPRRSL